MYTATPAPSELCQQFTTPNNADCIASASHRAPLDVASPLNRLFAVGCYEYREREQRRVGGIQLLLEGSGVGDDKGIRKGSWVDCGGAGILDLVFVPSSLAGVAGESALLCGISSNATLEMVSLTRSAITDDFVHSRYAPLRLLENPGKSVIGVGLDVFTPPPDRGGTCSPPIAIACCSEGSLVSSTITPSAPRVLRSWKGHDLECWTVAIDQCSEGRVFASGADDCCLKIWDIREGGAGEAKPSAINGKEHTMGVTVVAYNPADRNILITGSYDEQIRYWDCRKIGYPLCSQRAAGGVWRLKFHPLFPEHVQVAACNGGCQIMRMHTDKSNPPDIIGVHTSHNSLAYGITSFISQEDQQLSFASCSFYDKQVHFWRLPVEL